jgi:hypothetical protein
VGALDVGLGLEGGEIAPDGHPADAEEPGQPGHRDAGALRESLADGGLPGGGGEIFHAGGRFEGVIENVNPAQKRTKNNIGSLRATRKL